MLQMDHSELMKENWLLNNLKTFTIFFSYNHIQIPAFATKKTVSGVNTNTKTQSENCERGTYKKSKRSFSAATEWSRKYFLVSILKNQNIVSDETPHQLKNKMAKYKTIVN